MAIAAGAVALSACGGPQEVVGPPTDDGASDTGDTGRRRKGMGVEAEIGALDEGEVKRAFERASKQLTGCYGRGADRLPYLSGQIRFKVRVRKDGSARWVYIKDSSLGDHETEACMVGVLKGIAWPKPVDGEEGILENGFEFAPGSEERMPVEWSPDQLGAKFRDARPKLTQCREGAGTGPLKATLYIDTEGKAGGIGVSTSDEKGEGAVQCVIETLSGLKFPSPGSFASKVSVVID
jgi:hypothetical protein